MYDAIIVGCGLCGSVIARYLAEENDKKVLIIDRRNHLGGNMYDYTDTNEILVHKYGPHTFHTFNKELYEFICKYEEWIPYELKCMAEIDNKFYSTPFNFDFIDKFYTKEKAEKIKKSINEEYKGKKTATVLELLKSKNELIKEFAQTLYDKDFSLYAAKQWGVSPYEIDPSIFARVPIRFSYEDGYFVKDEIQVMPKHSYSKFFENLLNYKNITIQLEVDASTKLKLKNKKLLFEDKEYKGIVVYTGAIDELFGCCYGKLPYRSLRFEWETKNIDSFQPAPVVAYPQKDGYTRITEYKKLPYQDIKGLTTIAVEYSLQYNKNTNQEPYYPIPNQMNDMLYHRYKKDADEIENLYLCGRLADYKYYNMDNALERAICTYLNIKKLICGNVQEQK